LIAVYAKLHLGLQRQVTVSLYLLTVFRYWFIKRTFVGRKTDFAAPNVKGYDAHT